MAMYRIKKDDAAPDEISHQESYPPEEYWRETDPSYARDLDFDEIDELNRKAEDEESRQQQNQDSASTERPLRSPWARSIIALLVIVAVTLWIVI